MWQELSDSIHHQLLRTFWLIRSTLARWSFSIQSSLDPAPDFEQNETTEQYLQRVERKYALRYVDLQLNFLPPLDVEKLERTLNSENLPENEREHLETFLVFGKHRQKFLILKEMLLKG